MGPDILAAVPQFHVAAIQAAMIIVLFMRLRSQPKLNWLVASVDFLWLFFLYALTPTDYATRRGWP